MGEIADAIPDLLLLDRQLEEFKEIPGYHDAKGDIYKFLGWFSVSAGNFNIADRYLNESIEAYEKSDKKIEISHVMSYKALLLTYIYPTTQLTRDM